MKIQTLFFLIVVLILGVRSGAAQTSGKVVKVNPGEPIYKVKQGSPVQVSVVVDIDSGYHINSSRPAQVFLVPTALKLERTAGFITTPVRYPKAAAKKFAFSSTPMLVYEGRAILRFTARTKTTLGTGSHTLRGKLTVQACNDEACLRPQTIDVEIPIEVAPKA
jgi:cytochrome c biogenesis DsbD-like protein